MSVERGEWSDVNSDGTICELIHAQLQSIYDAGNHTSHEDEVVRLANIVLSATKTFGIYIIAIHDALEHLNYAEALRVGKAMVAHENMLHSIALGQVPTYGGTSH